MWGFSRDKRAVSPILGTVIMILLVVFAMSLIFAFFVDYVTDYQQGRGSSVMELVEIEDVYFRRVGGVDSVDVWLYNYGKIEVEVGSFYVNGLLVSLSDPAGSVVVLPFEHVKLAVALSYDWVPDSSYVFKVVTDRGSAVEREYFAPEVM